MNKVINLKINADKTSSLILPPYLASEFNLERKKLAYICFGTQKAYVEIKFDAQLPIDTISLSKRLMLELYLPEYPTYEINISNNKITLGPSIGLLVAEQDNQLSIIRLRKMFNYINDYSNIHGAIIVFTLDKVDTSNLLIEGYCYNPIKDSWDRGIFPYPLAIFRTIGLSDKWKKHFLTIIGDSLFNNRYFNKWEMYQWFSTDHKMRQYLPPTDLYHSPQELIDFIEKYKKVYIKPVSGLRGRGVYQVTLEKNKITFKHRESDLNNIDTVKTLNEALVYIENHFQNGKHLVQRSIDLVKYLDGVIDFRCIMQKNQSAQWECKAIIGRKGVKDSVVSNISSGGRAYRGLDLLKKALELPDENASALYNKIQSLAIEISKCLDDYGINCGSIGLDIGVDTQGNLWLIEINNRDPDPSIALDIKDSKLYLNLKAGILSYAKALSGFKV